MKLNLKIKKNKLIYQYLLITLFLLLDIIATTNSKISLAGYWSDRILFWTWFLTTIFTIKTYWKNKWAKRYFYSLLVFIVLTIIPMAIPFAGIVLSTTGQGLLYNKQISNKYRFEVSQYGFMGIPIMSISEKKGIIEKEILDCNGFETENSDNISSWEIKNVDFISENDSLIFLKVYSENKVIKVSLKKIFEVKTD